MKLSTKFDTLAEYVNMTTEIINVINKTLPTSSKDDTEPRLPVALVIVFPSVLSAPGYFRIACEFVNPHVVQLTAPSLFRRLQDEHTQSIIQY